MAPRNRASKEPTDFDKSLVSSIIQHTEPIWDSSPIKMPGWFNKLRKDVATADPAFAALLKYGYATSRGNVCCVSPSHAAALADRSFGPYEFDAPAPRDPSMETTIMAKTTIGFIFAADAPAAIAAAAA